MNIISTVEFSGAPSPTITWYFNKHPITPSGDFKVDVNVEKGESTLVIMEVYPEDEGEYMVKAENPLGTDISSAQLYVRCKYYI